MKLYKQGDRTVYEFGTMEGVNEFLIFDGLRWPDNTTSWEG